MDYFNETCFTVRKNLKSNIISYFKCIETGNISTVGMYKTADGFETIALIMNNKVIFEDVLVSSIINFLRINYSTYAYHSMLTIKNKLA